MEEKLFCSRCGYRIWRHADERRHVDRYMQNQHVRCITSLALNPPDDGTGLPDMSYVEMEVQKGGVQ